MALVQRDGSVTGELERAEEEAARFLKRCAELRKMLSNIAEEDAWRPVYIGSPETAAVRRASLDLTRALAKMRRR